jgi:hypothetical protein
MSMQPHAIAMHQPSVLLVKSELVLPFVVWHGRLSPVLTSSTANQCSRGDVGSCGADGEGVALCDDVTRGTMPHPAQHAALC